MGFYVRQGSLENKDKLLHLPGDEQCTLMERIGVLDQKQVVFVGELTKNTIIETLPLTDIEREGLKIKYYRNKFYGVHRTKIIKARMQTSVLNHVSIKINFKSQFD